ncbi:hypothetical protein, partial [Escherichia coli]|uniref:hypothetical protein n=1 Tax=Escherichia coli TaxID=562 RepID=UPI001BB086B6
FFFFKKRGRETSSSLLGGSRNGLKGTVWTVRPTQTVVSLRFTHQKGHQPAEQGVFLNDKENGPAGGVHCGYCD